MDHQFKQTVTDYLKDTNQDPYNQLERLTVTSRLNTCHDTRQQELLALNSHGLEKAREMVTDYLDQLGFYRIEMQSQMPRQIYIRTDERIGCVDLLVSMRMSATDIALEMNGSSFTIDTIQSWFNTVFSNAGIRIQIAEEYNEINNYIFYQREALFVQDKDLALQCFYPWLTVPMADYFKAYQEADEPVLILIGPPGMGKSTLLRTLLSQSNVQATLAHNQDVVIQPKLFSDFYRNNSQLLICEDSDAVLRTRDDENSVMSTILNETNGIVRHANKKVVFSTNLPSIDRIDPALTRLGRCYDILHFRHLTANEARTIRDTMKMEPLDFSGKDQWTLTEALARNIEGRQTVNRFARKVGF